mmetsp:Transcript_61227/g.145770  ORF Transcript_61227/g.145770 Transcript_61227/m.145770 type:complete len:412 (-) Transcript_61227:222-1457(-)
MGSLRRCSSIRCSGIDDGVASVELKPDQKPSLIIPESLAQVSCGPCTLSVTAHASGLAHIVVRTHMAYWSKGDKERLLEALARVCELGVDFFATFDLRAHQHVHPYITKVLTNLTSGGECWQRLRAAVVQVRENIFTTVRLGLVSAFVRTCLLDPFGPVGATGCPLLICRDDVVAREFCEASHRAWALNGQTFGPLAGSGFVSLDNVSEDRSAPETSSPATSKDVSSAGCVASLAPGIRRPGRGIAAPGSTTLPAAAITTLHELPNGDVRVIQSPARDVVLSSASSSSGSKSDTDSTAAGSSSKGGSAATSTGSIHSSGSGTDLSRSVAALKFECPAERLQPLVGTHLHVGELVFDAEVESYKRRYTACKKSITKAPLLPILWGLDISGCWKGILALLLRRRMAKKTPGLA